MRAICGIPANKSVAECDECVERDGVGMLDPLRGTVLFEQFFLEWFECGHDLGSPVERPANVDSPGPIGQSSVAEGSVLVGVFVAFVLVPACRGPGCP